MHNWTKYLLSWKSAKIFQKNSPVSIPSFVSSRLKSGCTAQEPNVPAKSFAFDGAYGPDSTTEAIYNDNGFALVEVTEMFTVILKVSKYVSYLTHFLWEYLSLSAPNVIQNAWFIYLQLLRSGKKNVLYSLPIRAVRWIQTELTLIRIRLLKTRIWMSRRRKKV